MTGPGFVLGPGLEGNWDEFKVSAPTVHRTEAGYRMWYYGQERNFPGGAIASGGDGIPMGRTGLAESADGVHWDRVQGPGYRGSVLDPSNISGRFDAWQVGGTDVVRDESEYRLYYMGAHDGEGESMGRVRKGFPLRIGVARGPDGVSFQKVEGHAGHGAAIGPGPAGSWDDGFVMSPRVHRLPNGVWRMSYHAQGSGGGGIGLAESPDGYSWDRRGRVFFANDDVDAFDSRGVSTRHIVEYQGGYLMAYEAMSQSGPFAYRLGLATSPDGEHWERLPGKAFGGAAIDVGGPGSWDERAVGTPYLVADGAGFRCYYVGFSAAGTSGIGMALSHGDLTRWDRHEP